MSKENNSVFEEEAKEFIASNYLPATSLADAQLSMTTQEIYENLLSIFPGGTFTAQQTVEWLIELGFVLKPMPGMQGLWLINMR